MARIKKYSPEQKLSSFQTFIVDDNPNSDYFRITEFKDTFTGGKNGFLIEGSEYLKESTEIKIELLDVNGDPIYYEPGNGIPEYYEGISKLIAVYIYEDTPIGLGKITILGELKQYDDNGVKRDVPEQWKGTYNVKWETTFQINKNLSNEDKVRFYRRPKVAIDEIVKPIFSKTPNTINQTGTISGTPLIPNAGSKLSSFSLPTSYRITTTDDSYWTGSVVGQTLNVSSLNYSPTITDVVSKTELVVDPPYAPNDVVSSFSEQNYSVDFVYVEGAGDLATALTGSFAKINITDMKTFVGDAARIKVFRRSQSQLSDYEFVQDIQLESTELLRDIETTSTNEEVYGNFTDRIIEEYWVTSSNDITVDFNQTFLYNSAQLSSTNEEFFFTTQSLSISSGVEYNLSFNVRKNSNTSSDDYIKAFLSGSLNGTAKSQTIATINSSNAVLQKTNSNENILADDFDEARLYFEVKGNDWYINNVSLKAAQETAFSPDEITFIQQVPKTLPSETFDYRFEFYDINNNYIPVLVDETKTFTGGNLNLFEKSIELVPDQLYFAFDSASYPNGGNPLPPTIINFEVNTTLVTGSINYSSQSFDFFGNEISASEYDGGQYPGLLQDRDTSNPFLTVGDFTGSRDDVTIQYVRYVAEVEGVSDSVIITRVQDGRGGVNFEIRPFRGTVIKNKQDKDLEVQAIRIDGANEIFLRGDMPQADFSLAKLRVQSGSEYITLSEASSSEFVRGLSAGTTGSGEIDYNVQVNGEAIDEALTLYLMDGPTSESILTSLLLTDLLDGLGSGFVEFSAEQFSLRPRLDTSYNPITASVTASFQKRGEVEGFISASLVVTPSASIDNVFNTHYYMFYETGSVDRRITVTATDLLDNQVDSGIPGESVTFFEAVETKQLTFNFTYTEDITSASVSVDKTFYIVPEGKPGDDAILVDIEPRIVQLNSNQRGEIYDYSPMDTEISVQQGRLPLTFNSSQEAGTFDIVAITPTNINAGTTLASGDISASIVSFNGMPNPILSGSVKYDLEIHPFFTASYFTQSVIQKVTKAVDGAAGIELFINPLSVNLTGDESGNVIDFTSGNTTLVVKQGEEYLTLSDTGTPGTFTASLNTKGIQPTLLSSSAIFTDGTYGDDTYIVEGFNQMPLLSASVDYNVTIYPFSLSNGQASGSTSLKRTQLFTKVLEGKQARTVKLNASSRVVVYDGNDIVVSPAGAITLEAVATGLTGSGYYQFFKDGFAYSLIDTDPDYTISSGDTVASGETTTWKVEVRDGAATKPVVVSDEITIAGIKNGGDAYSIQLSNEAVSVPVEVDGTVNFTNTGTVIRAYKGNVELTHVSSYSPETIDGNGDPIGTFGEFSASIESVSAYLTQTNIPSGNPATVGDLSGWTNPLTNGTGEVVYKVDLENGRSTFFKTQSFSVSLEGSVGPGIVFRGEYTDTIDYQYSVSNGRRDAVIYDKNGSGLADTYYVILQENGPSSVLVAPYGDTDSADYWQEMGTEDLFVAAEIGIFGESFVKNTINIGIPPAGNQNANIAIVGGTDEPYIAVGQSGTQGYSQPGVFLGLTNDGGPYGTSGTFGILSLSGVPDGGGSYNSLEWDGEVLTIRGAIRQTAAGQVEPSLRGNWADGTQYYINDSVIYNGQSWSANANHTSDIAGGASDGPPGTGPWDASSGTGKTVSLSPNTFVIEYAADGTSPSPSTISLFASSSNFLDPYFKFTGGGSFFTNETTFTDGADGNNDSVASIDISSTTISDMPLQFRVGVSDGDQIEVVSDVINVFGVQPGSDASPFYALTPIAGGTQIKNNSGTIQLQAQKIDSTGITNLSSGNIKIYKDDSSLLNATMSGITGDEYNPTITQDAISGTLTLELRDSSDDSVLDTITLLDVTDGLGGGSFISPNLKMSRQSDNSYLPTSTSLTASFYSTNGTEYTKAVKIYPNLDGGTDYMYYDNDAGAHTDSEITLTIDNGDGTVFSGTGIGNKLATKDVVVTAEFTDPVSNQTNTIVETVYIVSDGVDGVDGTTTFLTNESHTFPADSTGSVTDYSNSGTEIQTYEGATALTFQAPTIADANTNFEAICNSSITAGDTDMIFVESNIQGNDAGDIEFWKVLADAGLLWVYDVNDDTSFYNGTSEVKWAKIAGLTNTSGTTWRVDFADGYEISDTAEANAFIQFDFEAFDGDTSYQILSGSGNTLSNSEFTIEAATYKGFTGGNFPSFGGDATTIGTVSDLSSFTTTTGFINYVVKVKTSLSDEVRYVKKQSFTKASAGTDGVDGVSTTGFRIEYSTSTTAADPGSGKFRFNATDPASATKVYISETDLQGLGVGPLLDVLTTSTNTPNKSIITFRQIANQAYYESAYVTAQTDNGGWRTLDITHIDKNGWTNLSNGDSTFMAISVLGDAGAAGQAAGIVYAGEWTLTLPDGSTPDTTDKVVYLGEDDLKYVVKYTSGASNYWVCATTHRYTGPSSGGSGWVVDDVTLESGTYYICTSDTADPPSVDPPSWTSIGSSIAPGSWAAGWDAFGTEFTSVATDILFAQDVYADRTINIGSDGSNPVIALNADNANSNANPRIQIGQDVDAGEGFGDDGIYIGYHAGSPVLSFVTSSLGVQSFFRYESGSITLSDATLQGTGSLIVGSEIRVGETSPGSNLYNFRVTSAGNLTANSGSFQGTVSATGGNIGAWSLSSTALNSNFVELNASTNEISVFDSTNALRFNANSGTTLPAFDQASSYSETFNGSVFSTTDSSSGGPETNTVVTEFINVVGNVAYTPTETGRYRASFTYETDDSNSTYASATGFYSVSEVRLQLVISTASSAGSVTSGNIVAYGGQTVLSATGIDSGGGPISVVGNTEMLLSDGTIKLAKDITKDDKILVWDETINAYSEGTISQVLSRTVDSIFRVTAGGNEVEVSDTHGFWLDGGEEIKVKDIIVGETKIYIKDGNTKKLVVVDSVEEIFGEEEVYTLSVPQFLNYISNNIISHNVLGGTYPVQVWDFLDDNTQFTVSADLTASTSYYLYMRVRHEYSFTTRTDGDTNDIENEIHLNTTNDATIVPLSSGVIINGGGMQSVIDANNYFRFRTNAGSDPYKTDLRGGLSLDAMYGYDIANSNLSYLKPAYPWVIKAFVNFTHSTSRDANPSGGTSTPATNSTDITFYAGVNIDSVVTYSNGQGIYRINYTDSYSTTKQPGILATGGRESEITGIGDTGSERAAVIGIATSNHEYCYLHSCDNDANDLENVREMTVLIVG